MFDVGASELLLIAVVAIVVIGPKDMPLAMRTAGRWIGKVRRISNHFRAGIETMIREAELEEMEKKWREQNAQIMNAYPDAGPDAPPPAGAEARAGDAAVTPASPDLPSTGLESEAEQAEVAPRPDGPPPPP